MSEVDVIVTDRKFDVSVIERDVGATVAQKVVDVSIKSGIDVKVTRRTVDVVTVGIQGPRGGTGTGGGDGERLIVVEEAGIAISGHKVVALDGGVLRYADNTIDDDDSLTLGLSLNAAVLGGDVSVLTDGQVRHIGWSWVPGKPVFLGTSGNMTQTPPSSPAIFSLTIGHALEADLLNIDLEPSIRLPT